MLKKLLFYKFLKIQTDTKLGFPTKYRPKLNQVFKSEDLHVIIMTKWFHDLATLAHCKVVSGMS